MRKLILAVATTVAAYLAATLIIAGGATATTTTEHFSFADTSTSSGAPVWSVIATGAFTDGGTATKKSTGVLTLRFASGTITLHLAKGHKTPGMSQTATSCIETETESGPYTIAGGTGAYRGISGTGRLTLHNTFVEHAVNGNCSNAYAAVQSIITASGPVTLP